MEIMLSSDADAVCWEELAEVFAQAPLGRRDPLRLEAALRNSGLRRFAYAEGQLIGAGRALTDHVSHAAIYDIVVLPEFQRQGIGRRIIQSLVDEARQEVATVILYAVPGKESFYQKLGFRKMTTAMILSKNAEWLQEKGYTE